MERHEKLRNNTWQLFDGVNVTKDDLLMEFNNIGNRRDKAMKEDKALRFFVALKENDLLKQNHFKTVRNSSAIRMWKRR